MIDKRKIKAVGFDVDGTLYAHSTEMTIAMSQMVAEKAAKLLGRSDDDFAQEYLLSREKYRSNTLALNELGLDGEAIFQEVLDSFPLEKHVEKDPKLVKLIAELKKRYRIFIISNGTERQVKRKLKVLGINFDDFDPRICCFDHDWVKPEPAPYLAAIEVLRLSPEQIVYVGDREDVDVDGAKAVGMKAIYIGGNSSRADASIESVYDIVSIL